MYLNVFFKKKLKLKKQNQKNKQKTNRTASIFSRRTR